MRENSVSSVDWLISDSYETQFAFFLCKTQFICISVNHMKLLLFIFPHFSKYYSVQQFLSVAVWRLCKCELLCKSYKSELTRLFLRFFSWIGFGRDSIFRTIYVRLHCLIVWINFHSYKMNWKCTWFFLKLGLLFLHLKGCFLLLFLFPFRWLVPPSCGPTDKLHPLLEIVYTFFPLSWINDRRLFSILFIKNITLIKHTSPSKRTEGAQKGPPKATCSRMKSCKINYYCWW